jgi:hypothetical protein
MLVTGMSLALSMYIIDIDELLEANMKKFFTILGELWVAVVFAEAGAYESLSVKREQSRSSETACLRAA